jgi:hypothetical protein
LQDPSKFTQIWIFGLKKYHLATLIEGKISKLFSAMPKFMPKLNCCVFYKKSGRAVAALKLATRKLCDFLQLIK